MSKTTFTLAEAAQLLNCHSETLRRAIRDGSLQAARLGRGYRLSRSDLQTFWTAQGGGTLFDPDTEGPLQSLTDEEQDALLRQPARKKSARKASDPDPRQLSLIAPQGREP